MLNCHVNGSGLLPRSRPAHAAECILNTHIQSHNKTLLILKTLGSLGGLPPLVSGERDLSYKFLLWPYA
jgi:hypothetical protein